jgi:hypothetical protein
MSNSQSSDFPSSTRQFPRLSITSLLRSTNRWNASENRMSLAGREESRDYEEVRERDLEIMTEERRDMKREDQHYRIIHPPKRVPNEGRNFLIDLYEMLYNNSPTFFTTSVGHQNSPIRSDNEDDNNSPNSLRTEHKSGTNLWFFFWILIVTVLILLLTRCHCCKVWNITSRSSALLNTTSSSVAVNKSFITTLTDNFHRNVFHCLNNTKPLSIIPLSVGYHYSMKAKILDSLGKKSSMPFNISNTNNNLIAVSRPNTSYSIFCCKSFKVKIHLILSDLSLHLKNLLSFIFRRRR